MRGGNFRVFADGQGHWCCDKDDGTVGGVFSSRETAIRFALHESLHDNFGASAAGTPAINAAHTGQNVNRAK